MWWKSSWHDYADREMDEDDLDVILRAAVNGFEPLERPGIRPIGNRNCWRDIAATGSKIAGWQCQIRRDLNYYSQPAKMRTDSFAMTG
jgi:hypothetical protein